MNRKVKLYVCYFYYILAISNNSIINENFEHTLMYNILTDNYILRIADCGQLYFSSESIFPY